MGLSGIVPHTGCNEVKMSRAKKFQISFIVWKKDKKHWKSEVHLHSCRDEQEYTNSPVPFRANHYIAPLWPCLYEWQEGSPLLPWWHRDNNAGPAAGSRSVRQTVTLPASGLFGKPCWIAHFVCGIRAGAKLLHLLIPQLPACQRPDKAQRYGATVCTDKRQNCTECSQMFWIQWNVLNYIFVHKVIKWKMQ